MKILSIICIFQLLIILFLSNQLASINEAVLQLDKTNSDTQVRVSNAPPENIQASSGNSPVLTNQNESLIRNIIREEIQTQFSHYSAINNQKSSGLIAKPAPTTSDHQQIEVVESHIAQYIDNSQITSSQMEQLQSEIAQLDQNHRIEKFRQLAKEINSGKIRLVH